MRILGERGKKKKRTIQWTVGKRERAFWGRGKKSPRFGRAALKNKATPGRKQNGGQTHRTHGANLMHKERGWRRGEGVTIPTGRHVHRSGKGGAERIPT